MDDQQRLIGGRYRLSVQLGSGARGTVWSGYDEVLRRRVAVKELKVPPGVPQREAMAMRERMLREARALGIPTGPLRAAVVAAATLVTAASVAAAGIVGWVGLVVPHLARVLVGPSFPRLLPASAVLGGGYLLLIDTLARTAAAVEIPLGILTATVGTPFFIALLRRAHRGWA